MIISIYFGFIHIVLSHFDRRWIVPKFQNDWHPGQFEVWTMKISVCIYIYIILFWGRTWWTRLERRESMKRKHKKVWQSVSLREREEGGSGTQLYLISLWFVLFVLLHLHVHSNTTLQLFIRYYVQNTPSFQIIYIRMQNYVFCPFVALCTTKLNQRTEIALH